MNDKTKALDQLQTAARPVLDSLRAHASAIANELKPPVEAAIKELERLYGMEDEHNAKRHHDHLSQNDADHSHDGVKNRKEK